VSLRLSRILDRLSIQSKLLLMLLLASIFSILATGYIGYTSGTEALSQSRFNELSNLRSAKVYQVQSYFQSINNHIQTLSEDRTLIEAVKSFTTAFNQLNTSGTLPPKAAETLTQFYRKEFIPRLQKNIDGVAILESYLPQTPASQYLQYHYIAKNQNPIGEKSRLTEIKDGSDYSKVHKRVHPIVRTIVEKFKYYDFFLIDAESRNIVYTFQKEPDFTTNYLSGPYADSNLAKAVDAVLKSADREFIKFADYENYRASYAKPSAFMATPMFDGTKLVGILAIQISVDAVDQVMTNNRQWEQTGLGKTGETYLAGADYQMRSNSRFFLQDNDGYLKTLKSLGTPQRVLDRIHTTGTTILNQELRSEAVNRALDNQSGLKVLNDYRQVPSIIAYTPIEFSDVRWALVAKMDQAEAFAAIAEFRKRILITASIIIALITIAAMLLARWFVQPIYQIIAVGKEVLAGHLDTKVSLRSRDELRELGTIVNQMTDKLKFQSITIGEMTQENQHLLETILPPAVIQRFRQGSSNIADKATNVSILVAEVVGFNQLSMDLLAEVSVGYLNDLFSAFDQATEGQGVERIKTSGTEYLAVSGLMLPRIDHTKCVVEYAFILNQLVHQFNQKNQTSLSLRIGINSGPVVAGIVGKVRFSYNLWGVTVVQARIITSNTSPNEIWVGKQSYERLEGLYDLDKGSDITIGIHGPIAVWTVRRLEAR
jgi:class 3 adenylate cyclase/HAMP domain-containing protein